MGLTRDSTGRGLSARRNGMERASGDRIIALAGYPNVGKSTIFNGLTGMNQHTGNWAGKTVISATGCCYGKDRRYIIADTPGAYSLTASTAEEEITRDYICFGDADAVAVVCDATSLRRNMSLLLQVMETGKRTILIVNLMDEAKNKGIHIELNTLQNRLGIPVLGTAAREKASRDAVLAQLDELFDSEGQKDIYTVSYPEPVEAGVMALKRSVPELAGLDRRWLCLRLLEGEARIIEQIGELLSQRDVMPEVILAAAEKERQRLESLGFGKETLRAELAEAVLKAGDGLCNETVKGEEGSYSKRDRRIDRIVTSRLFGYPLMFLLLVFIFALTIYGANMPSKLLASGLFWLQDQLTALFSALGMPEFIRGLVIDGAYRGLAWVTSVMLPPMAIFFPLFTLLEDLGYLPRIAYNLDKPFKCCGSCGKQALTMAMGFGCNAAGVVGCRIISSPRERLLAIVTNSFVPCNGRFPAMISLIAIFACGSGGGGAGFVAALLFSLVILLGTALSFAVTKLLSVTLLKGEASSFILELPPYRRPQLGRIIVRSILDRTLYVLGRAACVAAPAGALLWLLANVSVGGSSLLAALAAVLEGPGWLLGLDGAILLAFILGFPANEIVLPITLMIYNAQGRLTEIGDIEIIGGILTQNGWTAATAACFIVFSLLHWPCSTTLMTIKKETGSTKWTVLSALIPTVIGVLACIMINCLMLLMG